MSGQPTRAGLSPSASDTALIGRLPAEWRTFGTFLRRPVLPDRADLALGGAARALAWLFALDMALMVLVLGAIGVAAALGMEMPDHMLTGFELTALVIAFIVVGAPLGEEALFRGWLSGRPGHVLAVAALLAGGGALALSSNPLIQAGGIAAGIVVALLALFLLRGRPAILSFHRHFAWFFYASAFLFAVVHLTNFGASGASLALLPLVLPQFVLALLLGYLRVNRGLMAAAALHMLHNAAFAGLMLLGASGAAS